MANYIALIRKQDFADLYKYGILHANRDCIVEFEGKVENLKDKKNIFRNLMAFANPFESSFAYLFLHYRKNSTRLRICDIEMQEVQNIFPFNEEAKIELTISFGDKIRISDPLWSSEILAFQKHMAYNESQAGVRNLWRIIGYDEQLLSYCMSIIDNNVLINVINNLYDDKRPSGAVSIWEYLLMYHRHNMYPRTSLGYFMDAFHVVVNRNATFEVDHYEPTQIYNVLDSLDFSLKSTEIYPLLLGNPGAQGILKLMNQFCPEVDFLNVATSFLYLKEKYSDGFVYEEGVISACNQQWPKEFPLAVFLLGWTLGYNKTYDCLYQKIALPVLKNKVSVITHEEHPQVSSVPIEPSNVVDSYKTGSNLSPEKDEHTKSLNNSIDNAIKKPFLLKMGKLRKDKRGFLKNPKPKVVTSKKVYEQLLSEGWAIIE